MHWISKYRLKIALVQGWNKKGVCLAEEVEVNLCAISKQFLIRYWQAESTPKNENFWMWINILKSN
jgi:hypothetical protein